MISAPASFLSSFSLSRSSCGETYIDNRIDNSLLNNIVACSGLAFKLDNSKFNHFANFLQCSIAYDGISLCALHKGYFDLRFELRFARFTTALRAWYNSSCKLQCTLFLKLGSHYQRVSLMPCAAMIPEIAAPTMPRLLPAPSPATKTPFMFVSR